MLGDGKGGSTGNNWPSPLLCSSELFSSLNMLLQCMSHIPAPTLSPSNSIHWLYFHVHPNLFPSLLPLLSFTLCPSSLSFWKSKQINKQKNTKITHIDVNDQLLARDRLRCLLWCRTCESRVVWKALGTELQAE